MLPVLRRNPIGTLLGLYNFSDTWRPYPSAALAQLGLGNGTDIVSGQRIYYGDDGNHWLPPYGFRWLKA